MLNAVFGRVKVAHKHRPAAILVLRICVVAEAQACHTGHARARQERSRTSGDADGLVVEVSGVILVA